MYDAATDLFIGDEGFELLNLFGRASRLLISTPPQVMGQIP
jgi:hypothetical protein